MHNITISKHTYGKWMLAERPKDSYVVSCKGKMSGQKNSSKKA